MEIFRSKLGKPLADSQQKKSPAPAVKLRLLGNSTASAADVQEKPVVSRAASFAVQFKPSLKAARDIPAQQQIQPLMVRNFFDATKQQMVKLPDLAMRAQANSTPDVVASLLA